jgi:hypothetical protein
MDRLNRARSDLLRVVKVRLFATERGRVVIGDALSPETVRLPRQIEQ